LGGFGADERVGALFQEVVAEVERDECGVFVAEIIAQAFEVPLEIQVLLESAG
jgi:hypothetical protein